MSDDGTGLAVYRPYETDVRLSPGVRIEDARARDLAARRAAEVDISDEAEGRVLSQPEWNGDTLVVADVVAP